MFSDHKYIKYIIYTIAAIMAGIFLFILQAASYIDSSILNPEFHKNLFVKNSIYTHVQNVVTSSVTDFSNNMKKYSRQQNESDTEVFNMFLDSVTPDMIKTNVDSLREGLFQYFKGDRKFLPDIYLTIGSSKDAQNPGFAINTATQALAKVDKINLSAILLYINRNDISDHLLVIKIIYYLLNKIPGFSLLFMLFFIFIGVILCKKLADVIKWAGISLVSCGIIELTGGIALVVLSYFIIPRNINPVAMSLPLQGDVIISYIHDCLFPVIIFLMVSGLVSLVLSAVLLLLPRFLPRILIHEHAHSQDIPYKYQMHIKYSLYIIFFTLIISTVGYKLYALKKDFELNDFNDVISRMRNTSTFTQVISAKDDTIYALQVKLVDKKSGKLIPNIQININGKSNQDKSFDENGSSDASGATKFVLDKGTFRLSFISSGFPSDYQIPSPFFFDLKEPGITIITVNFDNAPEKDRQKPGIAEIEVLDSNNKPVTNLELSITGTASAPGYPDNIFSYTNSEGLAVFKVSEGNYKVGFSETGFPKQYTIPASFEAIVKSNTVNRYTIRLSENKNMPRQAGN